MFVPNTMRGPEFLQPAIPEDQRLAARRPLPGIQPLDGDDWLTVDEAYGAQMRERARLMRSYRDDIVQRRPEAEAAERELLENVLALLDRRRDFRVEADAVTRPDGETITLETNGPLETLGHLIAEDLCILQKTGDAHVLTAAVLCFPASWTLAEKIGKPLVGLHRPVTEYDQELAQRVQRLFDGVQVGRPLWRANLLRYADPALYQPRPEDTPRPCAESQSFYERSERQVIWRLPETGAVIFAIHTTVARHRDQ